MARFDRFIRQGRRVVPAIALLVGVALGQSADAASVSSFIEHGHNFASDENREYLIDRVVTETGQVDVGDSIRGILNMNTLNSSGANLGGATGNNEWTGVFQLLVTGKQSVAGFTLFTFAPDPAFALSLCGGVASCTNPAVSSIAPGTGAILVMFEDTTMNFAGDFDDPSAGALGALTDDGTAGRSIPPSSADVSSGLYATEEAFLERAADGTRFWTLGFTNGVPGGAGSATPGVGEGFTGLASSDTILQAFTLTAGSGFVLNNAGLNRIGNGIAETGDSLNLGVVPTVFGGSANFALTGNTRGVADLDTPFEASSNIEAAFFIPNPGSFVLMGLGLAMLFGAARRGLVRR
jgi:hypothetical protein